MYFFLHIFAAKTFIMENKKKDSRGRKPIPAGERKVFLRVGVKAKYKKEAQYAINEVAKKYQS